MARFITPENPNALTPKRKIVILVYLGLIGVIAHYAFPSAPMVDSPQSGSINLHYKPHSANYMTEGDNYILDDEISNGPATKKAFILFLALAASLITSFGPGFKQRLLKSSINSFRYNTAFAYSHLRSPPSK